MKEFERRMNWGLVHVWVAVVVATLFISDVNAQAQRVRKEVRDLSDEEWSNYAAAVGQLKANGEWDRLANFHGQLFSQGIHRSPQFLPWHRQFLQELEDLLNDVSTANASIAVPYWDWTLDAQDPGNSPVFDSDRFGGFSPRNGACITTGSFTSFSPCIRRNTFYRVAGFDANDVVEAYGGAQGNDEYETMRQGVEGIHNLVHVGVGGNMNSRISPYDPIFYSHHAFIDKIWFEWQQLHPDNARAYPPGLENDELVGYNGVQVSQLFRASPFARRLAGSSSDFADFAQGGSDAWTTETRKKLGKLPLEALAEIPRTCTAPNKPDNVDEIWSSKTDDAIAFSTKRVQTGLESVGNTCLNQAAIDETVKAFGEPEEPSGFPVAPVAGVVAGCIIAVVAFVVLRRNSANNSNADAEQPRPPMQAVNPYHYPQHQHGNKFYRNNIDL